MTTLYRLFSSNRQLLYIGIAQNPGLRFAQHASDKPWWPEVTTIELQACGDRHGALEAERKAIVAERPLYNVVHNGGGPSRVVVPIRSSARHYPDRLVEPRSFDHVVHVSLPEYHALRLALSNLLNAGAFHVEDIVDMVLSSYAGDFCDCCREQWAGDVEADWDPTCWPYAAEVQDGWMLARYRCPRTGHEWTCGYTARAERIASLP